VKKTISKIIVAALAVPLLALGVSTPAFADGVNTIDNWATTVTPNKDGSVTVVSDVTPNTHAGKIRLSLPKAASFLGTTDYKETNNKYDYKNISLDPQGLENYNLSTAKRTVEGNSWNDVPDVDWLDIDVSPKNGEDTPFTLTYTVDGSLTNASNSKSEATYQQLNLPMLDTSFSPSITNYSIKVADANNVPLPDTACVRNVKDGSEKDLSCDYAANGSWSDNRGSNNKVSLRAKYPANTFAVGENPNKSYLLPKEYLKQFNSWDYSFEAKQSTGQIDVTNTVKYDSSSPNSDTIAIAYPVANKVGKQAGPYFYNYTAGVLSEESAKLYDLTFAADNEKNLNTGIAVFLITPKKGVKIPEDATVTYSYTITNAVSDLKTGTDAIGFRPVSDILNTEIKKLTVNNVFGNSLKPKSADSTCNVEKENRCSLSDDGSTLNTFNVDNAFYVDYFYNSGTFANAASPITTSSDDFGNFMGAVGRFLVNLVSVAIFAILAFLLWRYFTRRTADAKANPKKVLKYETIKDKPATFIPSKFNNGINLKKVVSSEEEVQGYSYRPPTIDSGKKIPSHLFFFVDGSLPESDHEKAPIVLSLIMSMVRKGVLNVETYGGETFITRKSTVAAPGFEMHEAEEAVSSALMGENRKNFKLNTVNLAELYTEDLEQALVSELKELQLHKVGKKNPLATAGFVSSGAVLLLGALGDAVLTFGMGASWLLLGAGVVTASGGVTLFKTGLARLGAKYPILTPVGSGYNARMETFKNFFDISKPTSRYSLEKSDDKVEYLPWAVAFGETRKWLDVFARPGSKMGTIIINDQEVNTDIFSRSLENITKNRVENLGPAKLYLTK
jgi:hypothetical protein